MYQLNYLPSALQDMKEIAYYISFELLNPSAADKISARLIKSAEDMTMFPYANPVYQTIRTLRKAYRKLLVENYLMFYFVDETCKTVIIAHVRYAKCDHGRHLSE